MNAPLAPDQHRAAYLALTARAQVVRIRRVAEAALADYDIGPARLRLVAHDFNTTFRVDTADGRRFAMRVNVNSQKAVEHLDAELAWLTALAHDTDVRVPAPHPTRTGDLRTDAWCEALGRQLPVVLMSWLPGKDLGDGTVDSVRALGRTTAALHEHAAGWSLPAGMSFPSHASVLVDVPDRLSDDHPALDDRGRQTLVAARRVAQAALDRAMAQGPIHAIHADLHGGNVKWFRRQIAVFDFDDAVMGVPVLDLAISAYYLRGTPELEQALFAGYAEARAVPAISDQDYEAIVAGRNVLLVNDVLGGMGAADRDFAPPYLRNSVKKLRAFLDTGVYRHDVADLEPITF